MPRDISTSVAHAIGGRRRRAATVGTLDPQLDGVNVDEDDLGDLLAFLQTLHCPPLAEALVAEP